MKGLFILLFLAAPVFAQQISPIQTAVLNDDTRALESLIAQGEDWLFVRKPSKNSEGELLLDFALANGKIASYNALIAKGALPGVATVFTAVKSRNYILAKQLSEAGGLVSYASAEISVPRYIISNKLETNISAVFSTNVFTNISQFAVTNALGGLNVREYTNFSLYHTTNFYTNIRSRVITNTVQASQTAPALGGGEASVSYVTLTNVTPSVLTNYKDSIYTYTLTNNLGQSVERVITNVVPELTESLLTNITRRPITNASPAPPASVYTPKGYTLKSAVLSRLNYIDLARLAESQGSKESSVYFLEKAQSAE